MSAVGGFGQHRAAACIAETQHLRVLRDQFAARQLEVEIRNLDRFRRDEGRAEQLREAGFAAKDVRHVFLSHIHFDHAGAAWRFAKLGATIYVHPRGAPHLLDPTKLIDSATRIYGDAMKRLWGQFAPIAEQSVMVLHDMDVVRVGPFEVRAIATPGHASHHNVYQWEDNVFGGDVAGVRLGGGPPVPPFVPPELHIESWQESIEKIHALNAKKLYLPHFGPIMGSVSAHLDALDERRNERKIRTLEFA